MPLPMKCEVVNVADDKEGFCGRRKNSGGGRLVWPFGTRIANTPPTTGSFKQPKGEGLWPTRRLPRQGRPPGRRSLSPRPAGAGGGRAGRGTAPPGASAAGRRPVRVMQGGGGLGLALEAGEDDRIGIVTVVEVRHLQGNLELVMLTSR